MKLVMKLSAILFVALCTFPMIFAVSAHADETTLWLKKDDGRVVEVQLDQFQKGDRRVVSRHAEGNVEVAKPTPTGPVPLKTEAVSLKIARGKSPFNNDEKYDPDAEETMELQLLVTTLGKKTILAFDRYGSKLHLFNDDKESDLLKEKDGSGTASFWSFPECYDGGKQCVVQINSPCKPAPGCTKLHLKADLVFRCTTGKTVTEEKKITPAKPGSFTYGDKIEVKYTNEASDNPFSGMFEGMMSEMFNPNGSGEKPKKAAKPQKPSFISLSSNTSFDNIKSIVFLGPDGKTIQHKNNGSGSCDSGEGRVYTVDYVLEKEVKSLTIKITCYKEIEEVTLPVDMEVGLGL